MTDTRLAEAVEDALRAPSVHNTQPWKWRVGADAIELHADWDRHLTVHRPRSPGPRHQLRCGAAPFAGRPRRPQHRRRRPAAARPGGPRPSRHSRRPGPGRAGRRGAREYDRRCAVPRDRRAAYRPAEDESPPRPPRLRASACRACRPIRRAAGPGHRPRGTRPASSRCWSTQPTSSSPSPATPPSCGRGPTGSPVATTASPAANVAAPPIGALGPSPLRRYTRTGLSQPPQEPGHGPGDDAAELLVVATPGDDDLDRLRAGEATSAVLLAATRLGLATTPLSQALEVPPAGALAAAGATRTGASAAGDPGGPPASGGAELPATPRRSLAHVLLP